MKCRDIVYFNRQGKDFTVSLLLTGQNLRGLLPIQDVARGKAFSVEREARCKETSGVWGFRCNEKVLEVSEHPNYGAFRSRPPTIPEVVDWLSMRKVIVVIDDLDSWEDWKDYVNLAEQVPPKSSIFIISSRQLFDVTKHRGLASMKVGPIAPRYANHLLEFLMEDRQFELSDSEQEQVIEFADGNPLLIRLAMALVQNKLGQVTFDKLLGRKSALPVERLLGSFRGGPAEKFLVDDIYTALSGDARKVVVALAVLNKIPSDRVIFGLLGKLVGLSASELKPVLKGLEFSSLVNRKGSDQNPQDMHEVVRDLILQKDRPRAEEFSRKVAELLEG